MHDYRLTNDWFERTCRENWEALLPARRPQRVLEIGSFEGASTCFLLERLANLYPLELHCIDTWEGGIEHQSGGSAQVDMNAVEGRFWHNVNQARKLASYPVDLQVHKGLSHQCMAALMAAGKEDYFDFIYVDGSHQAPDVLCDAVLAFKLLKVGATLGFDDYLWSDEPGGGDDPLRSPKPAVDAFLAIYAHKVKVLDLPPYQLYLEKLES